LGVDITPPHFHIFHRIWFLLLDLSVLQFFLEFGTLNLDNRLYDVTFPCVMIGHIDNVHDIILQRCYRMRKPDFRTTAGKRQTRSGFEPPAHFIRLRRNTLPLAAGIKGSVNRADAHMRTGGLG
jgi:hypothetical protein